MTNSRGGHSDHLTFSRRHGYEPLPEPMQLEELSENLRREIFNEVRRLFLRKKNNWGYFVEDEARFVERVFGRFFGQTEDQIGNRYDDVMDRTNRIIIKRAFHKVLDFLEIMINDGHDTMHFLDRTKDLFEQHGAAYWLDTLLFLAIGRGIPTAIGRSVP